MEHLLIKRRIIFTAIKFHKLISFLEAIYLYSIFEINAYTIYHLRRRYKGGSRVFQSNL